MNQPFQILLQFLIAAVSLACALPTITESPFEGYGSDIPPELIRFGSLLSSSSGSSASTTPTSASGLIGLNRRIEALDGRSFGQRPPHTVQELNALFMQATVAGNFHLAAKIYVTVPITCLALQGAFQQAAKRGNVLMANLFSKPLPNCHFNPALFTEAIRYAVRFDYPRMIPLIKERGGRTIPHLVVTSAVIESIELRHFRTLFALLQTFQFSLKERHDFAEYLDLHWKFAAY